MDAISNMSVGQLARNAIEIIVGLSVFVEVVPIKVNPISAIFSWIGGKINKELIKKVDALETKVNRIEASADERNAIDCRVRILHFGDELLHEIRHSKEHFDQILSDIDEYEKYCFEHPEFKNNKTVIAKKRIIDVYTKHMELNDFC